MRYGYHLVTDCRKANQGKKSHKDVEATIIHHFNTYTSFAATKAAPFPNGTQADILLSGITAIDNPAARNLYLDVTSTNPMVVTNQEFFNRAALNHQPGPGEHDPRNDRSHSLLSPRDTGGHGASTATVYFLFASICATRVYRRTCSWACSTRTSRLRSAGARLPK